MMANAALVPADFGVELSLQTQQDGLLTMRVAGDLTKPRLAGDGDPLRQVLGAYPYRESVLLDLSEVAALDTSGLNWLLDCHKRVRDAGGHLILHSLSPLASNAIRVLNLQTVFHMAGNEQQARALLDELE